MDKEYAIEVHNVKKKFKLYYDKGNLLKEKIIFHSRNRYEEKWVLKGISFNVRKGEAIGLVGHNGCGKSTTLKLLTRIMFPDEGKIVINGRVSSLLELGAGFHPDMSGRENIYINASIFGLTRKEIDRRIDDIIDFSELGEYIDNPVRTYSSGMYMRLAFSVAINVDADILLIDEILAVGDVNFQIKCFNKLFEIKEKGTTIVIVSHSLGQIEQICERSIWIHDGMIRAEGSPRQVHRQYLTYMGEHQNQKLDEKDAEESVEDQTQDIAVPEEESDNLQHSGSGEIVLKKAYITNAEGKVKTSFATAQDIILHVYYHVKKKVDFMNIGVSVFRNDGLCCYGISTKEDSLDYFKVEKDGKIHLTFNNINLLAGKYSISVGIEDNVKNSIDFVDKICEFDIYTTNNEVGSFYLDHQWKVDL